MIHISVHVATLESKGKSLGNRLPYTPTSKIRAMARQLWLRSRERAAALKAAGYRCQECGAKQSKAKGREVKLNVHHIDGIKGWEKVFAVIRAEILCPPDRLRVLCEACHLKEKDAGTSS